MNIKIVNAENNDVENLQKFLFKQIKKEYGYDYVEEYHKDIVKFNEYYLNPSKNNFFIAVNTETNEIIGSIGIRGYDKQFEEFENIYTKNTTASIWRLFVDSKYRRCGLATELYKKVEDFSSKNSYRNIYLHTHKNLNGALEFWEKMGFKITVDTNNELQTVHMEKNLTKIDLTAKTIQTTSIKS